MNPTIKLLAHRPVVFCDRPSVLQLLVKVMPPLVRTIERPPMNIALAIDQSGSMSGPPLMNARAAARMLVDQMGPVTGVMGMMSWPSRHADGHD